MPIFNWMLLEIISEKQNEKMLAIRNQRVFLFCLALDIRELSRGWLINTFFHQIYTLLRNITEKLLYLDQNIISILMTYLYIDIIEWNQTVWSMYELCRSVGKRWSNNILSSSKYVSITISYLLSWIWTSLLNRQLCFESLDNSEKYILH